jgi:AraC-like DNA-binding protein
VERRFLSYFQQLVIDRRIGRLSPDAVWMAQSYDVRGGRYQGPLVSGPAWLFSWVRVARGQAFFARRGGEVRVSGRFALFLPPFSTVQVRWERCLVESLGALSFVELGSALPAGAVVFDAPSRAAPHSVATVLDCLQRGRRFVDVDASPPAGSLAGRAKAAFDRSWDSGQKVSAVAQALGVAPAQLTRAFRAATGLKPLEYRQRIQVMGALVRMGLGANIADAAFSAGFADLTTFYRQFKRWARARPSSYRL